MSWPMAEQQHRPVSVPQRRRRPLPKITWVLVVAAFLCGGLLSAAGFAVGWKHQAQQGTSAESALVAATSAAHTLRSQLVSTRTALAAEQAHARTVTASRQSAVRTVAKLRASLAAAQQSAAGIAASAAPLGADLGRLTSELRALTSYATSTPSGQLDAGYLQAQLAYLAKTVNGFSSAVAALTAPQN
jgi:hypothetical protein